MNALASKPPIRVAIRGCCGSQGAELSKLIRLQKDMELTLGIAVPDKSFSRIKRMQEAIGGTGFLPEKVLIDGAFKGSAPRGLEIANGNDLNGQCDILVDATAFTIPVHLQYPDFKGMILTFEAQTEGTKSVILHASSEKSGAQERLFRISDCVGSALGSIISPFIGEGINAIFASVVKNIEGRINGALPPDRANAISRMPEHVRKVRMDMGELLGTKTVFRLHMYFHPGIREYSGELDMVMKDGTAPQRIRELLAQAPHTLVVKAGELDSTSEPETMRKLGSIPPIVACAITSNKPSNEFKILFTIGSETIGPVHAIDAIRHLETGLVFSECAKITDANLGWAK